MQIKNHKNKYKNKIIKKNLKLKNIIKIRELSKNIQELKVSNTKGSESLDMLAINLKNKKSISPINLLPYSKLSSKLSSKLETEINELDLLPMEPGSNENEVKNSNNLYLLNNLKSSAEKESLSNHSPLKGDESKNKIINYLNSFTLFNKSSSKEQSIMYQFNKANNKPYKFIFDKTSNLLKLSFLSMGCLISKPVYKVIYTKNNLEFEHNTPLQNTLTPNTQKIIIDLFYFIRKNKNKYLNKIAEINENIIYISHPKYATMTPNRKGAIIFKNILCKYNDKFQFLSDYLSSIFRSEVELNLVRLPKTYYDSNILVQDLGLKSYKFRFVKLVSRLYRKAHISASSKQTLDEPSYLSQIISFPSYLSGINVKLAGRTFRQRVVPRMTVKRSQKGSLSNVNVQFIDRARFTGKTRRGSFSFTVTLGHVFK